MVQSQHLPPGVRGGNLLPDTLSLAANRPADLHARSRRYVLSATAFSGHGVPRRSLPSCRFDRGTCRIPCDDGLQRWSASPLEALVIVHIPERTDQIQVHDRKFVGNEAIASGFRLQPVQAEINPVALAPQVSDLI